MKYTPRPAPNPGHLKSWFPVSTVPRALGGLALIVKYITGEGDLGVGGGKSLGGWALEEELHWEVGFGGGVHHWEGVGFGGKYVTVDWL